MRVRDYIYDAIRGLRMNPTRTFLTALGIIIGVGSVTLLSIIGEGARAVILDATSGAGSLQISIFAGPGDGAGRPDFENPRPLKIGDAESLRNLPELEAVSPLIFINGQASFEGEEVSATAVGVHPDFFKITRLNLKEGNFMAESDNTGGARVAVLGSKVANTLFPFGGAVGNTIKFKTHSFQVIGVLAGGSGGFGGQDRRVYIPETVARLLFSSSGDLTAITVAAREAIPPAMEAIRMILRDRRNIINPTGDLALDDFRVSATQDAISILTTVTRVLSLFLTSIAAISLLVGGIGIMNIMLVAVTERTREIGLRKAVGATPSTIATGFLTEAIALCASGGIIGASVGILIGWILSLILPNFVDGWAFVLPWTSIGIAIGISAGIGLLFGTYPAVRASRLNPIESLRYE